MTLPNSPFLGNLEIAHVYEYYEGPRLFHAVNGAGNNYIAFWVDTDEESDIWLYSAISSNRLELLNQSQITLRDVFVYPEDLVLKVRTFFDWNINSEIVSMSHTSLSDEILPPADFIIENNSHAGEVSQYKNISELYIRSIKGIKAPSLSAVAKVSNAFSLLYNSVMHQLNIKTKKVLTPLDARQGSFILRLNSPNINECVPFISEVFRILNHEKNPYLALVKLNVDIGAVENLLAEIVDGKVKLQFSKEGVFDAELNISEDQANVALSSLRERSSAYISSSLVPQADDLSKVFKVVALKASSITISPEMLGLTTDRQVSYYLHAARVLGFLNSSNAINSVGYQFIQLEESQKMNVAAIRFESSDCGWAWLKWSHKSTLEEIDPNSAAQFLIDMCPSLSKDTAERRAQTLKKWQKELARHRFSNS